MATEIGKTTTVEAVLERIQSGRPWRGLLLLPLILFVHPSTLYVIYFPNFGGFIPYTEWKCVNTSSTCTGRATKFAVDTPSESPYSRKVLCGGSEETALELDKDFVWNVSEGRSSYAVEWNMFCGTEYKGTLLSSLYFVGGFVGLLVGSFTFDRVGRRLTLVTGYTTVALCMMLSAAAPDLGTLMAIRTVMGIGSYMGLSGMYVYIVETTAIKWRAFVSSLIGMMWGIGSLVILPTMAYLITSWRWLSGAGGVLMLISVSTWIIMPASPIQLMENRGDKQSAVQSLKRLAKLLGTSIELEGVDLRSANKRDAEPSSYFETLKDFIIYPELRTQLLIQMFQWVVIAFLYYGFVFSWSKLGKNIYWSYVFAGIAEIAAALICWFGQEVLGRKITILSFYLIGAASFLLALIPLSLGSQTVLTMEQLMCLIGSMFVSGAWGTIYLYVAEQSPTSHRGKMSAICSMSARLGSFAGPQASLLISWNKPATLVLFSVLAASAGLVTLRLPETKGVQSPNTAQEVEERRRVLLEGTSGKPETGAL